MYIARSRCVDSVRLTEALLSIDGVLPPVDVVCLGMRPTYTLLVVNQVGVVVKYLRPAGATTLNENEEEAKK